MKKSSFEIQLSCAVKRASKSLKQLSFKLHMCYLALTKAKTSNNKRKMQGKPIFRKRAYIKAFKNKNI